LDKYITVGAVILLLTAMLMSGPAWGLEKQPADVLMAAKYSMVGLRLGAWISSHKALAVEDVTVQNNMPDAGFYTELFLDYRVTPVFMLEGSLGIASRGDAVIEYQGDPNRYIGTINLYQALAQIKLSPLAGRSRSVLPFIIGGGGVAWGRQSIDYIVANSNYYNPDVVNRTETAFMAVIGAGIDIPLAEQVGLNVAVKYHPITFSNPLVGVKDYSGTAVSVGAAYFWHKK
jgi:hypothetical protein